jgi:hypothetical protein
MVSMVLHGLHGYRRSVVHLDHIEVEQVAQLNDSQVVHLDYVIIDRWPTAYSAMAQVDHISGLEVDHGSTVLLNQRFKQFHHVG